MQSSKYEILKQTGTTFNLPLYLESSVDEMGVMVGFDGEIQQVEQLVNFSYSGVTGTRTVNIYSTTNPDKLRKIVDQVYSVNWGDGLISGLTINSGTPGQSFPSLQHTYNTFYVTNSGSGAYLINGKSNPTLSLTKGQTYTFNISAPGHPFWIKTVSSIGTINQYNNGITNNGIDNGTITFIVPTGSTSTLYYNCQFHSSMNGTINLVNTPVTYTISITLNSPWSTEIISKNISIPFLNPSTIINPLGSFSGVTMPIEIDYINQLDNSTGLTENATIKFMGIGKSRIEELRKYGQTTFNGVTTGTTDGSNWSGYTLDNLYYRDFTDGYTMITGSTSSFTKEEVINRMITRNEHFIGFIDEPTIYSDIFVERGKQGVMEKNLRLGEIDNIGEVDIYGNGYFNVRKQ